LTAAYVGDGEDEAAIDETETCRRKARVGGQAIGAIGILQQRGGPVAGKALAVDERHRDALTIPGGANSSSVS